MAAEQPDHGAPGATSGYAAEAALHWLALAIAVALVAWIRLVPLSLRSLELEAGVRVLQTQADQIEIASSVPEAQRIEERRRRLIQWKTQHQAEFASAQKSLSAQMQAQFSYAGEDSAQHVFLGDADSYHWLRMARNYLRAGTTCDAVVKGECRDTYANAPVGRRNIYSRSLHIAAIVVIHRLVRFFRPGYPLAASAFLVPVIVGVLGVFPAYALGRRFGGELGGLSAAVMSGLNPLFLQRSAGSDDDVWNVVIPLFMVWAAVEALYAVKPRRQAGHALLAAGFAGLHAAVWTGWVFSYGVVLMGMLAALVLECARYLSERYTDRRTAAMTVRRVAIVTGIFYAVAGFFTWIAGAEAYLGLPLDLVTTLIARAGGSHQEALAAASLIWPDVFATVAELAPPNLPAIAGLMGAPVLFFISWLGLLLLLLPKSDWQAAHFVLLIGGNYLYWYLLSAPPPGRLVLIALLAAPLATAIALSFFSTPRGAEDNLGGGLILTLWFLSALFLSYQAIRLTMLLVPPCAIAFGVALGRLREWLDQQVNLRTRRIEWLLHPAIFGLLAAVLLLPIGGGYASASGYLPLVDGAWYSVLTNLRKDSSPDAIVNTWWDYGYWTKYFADRRVIADGGSLATHIPYWSARVLAAPTERESAGLLRMIDCGSDATPQPEGIEGAYGKLLLDHVDGFRAVTIVNNLAQMGKAQARAYLASQKLDRAAQDDILRSTHCDPPPAYLLLSNQKSSLGGWWYIANWDFGRAYMLTRGRMLPEVQASAVMTGTFGYSAPTARSLYEQAQALKSKTDEMAFTAPSAVSVAPEWTTCRAEADTLVCNAHLIVNPMMMVERITYDPGDPAGSRLLLANNESGADEEVPPAVLITVQAGTTRDIAIPSAPDPTLGLLVDATHLRVIVAAPGLLRSTYSRLVNLNGGSGKFFTKVYEQTGFWNEQVSLWKVNWQRLREDDQPPP